MIVEEIIQIWVTWFYLVSNFDKFEFFSRGSNHPETRLDGFSRSRDGENKIWGCVESENYFYSKITGSWASKNSTIKQLEISFTSWISTRCDLNVAQFGYEAKSSCEWNVYQMSQFSELLWKLEARKLSAGILETLPVMDWFHWTVYAPKTHASILRYGWSVEAPLMLMQDSQMTISHSE